MTMLIFYDDADNIDYDIDNNAVELSTVAKWYSCVVVGRSRV